MRHQGRGKEREREGERSGVLGFSTKQLTAWL